MSWDGKLNLYNIMYILHTYETADVIIIPIPSTMTAVATRVLRVLYTYIKKGLDGIGVDSSSNWKRHIHYTVQGVRVTIILNFRIWFYELQLSSTDENLFLNQSIGTSVQYLIQKCIFGYVTRYVWQSTRSFVVVV